MPFAATRQWQPSASSKPPPSGVPCNAATTGFGIVSIISITSPRPGGCSGLPNSVMSAPAAKVRPALASTTALTEGSSRSAFIASYTPLRTAWPSAFTGGLSMVTTAISPSLRTSTTELMYVSPELHWLLRFGPHS